MSFGTAFLAAAALLSATTTAHMTMQKPVPFSVDKLDNGPITASQFPCKSNLGFTVSTLNKMAVGQDQTFQLKGSARHGGGSCQLSITTDETPTANSKFKVIMTMEGGCPDQNAEKAISFKLPDSIPNGKATFAWTWMPVLSGQPEFYMNCAPIEVTGGASDTSKFNQLPDLFVANINDCKSPPNFNVKIPNPGTNYVTNTAEFQTKPATGNCAAGSGGNGGGDNNSPPKESSKPSSAPAATGAPTGNPGGVFAPTPVAPTSTSQPNAAPSTQTTLLTLTTTAQKAPPTATGNPPAATTATGAPAPAPTGTAPSAPSTGGGSACSQDGAVVCNGPNQFGLCNHGQVVWQNVAAGTTCSNGAIQRRDNVVQLRGRRYVIPDQEFNSDE